MRAGNVPCGQRNVPCGQRNVPCGQGMCLAGRECALRAEECALRAGNVSDGKKEHLAGCGDTGPAEEAFGVNRHDETRVEE